MTAPVKRNRGRLVLIGVLALSLLGNAVTLGAVMQLRSVQADVLGPAADGALFARAERKHILAAIRANSDILRPQMHALAAARAEVVRAGTARPFDRAALDLAMVGFRTQLDQTTSSLQAVIADALEAAATR